MSLAPATLVIPENGGQGFITATLSAKSTLDTTVTLGFVGSAVLGTNFFTSINGGPPGTSTSFTIPAGSLSAQVILTAKLDGKYGPNLTTSATIASVVNGIAGVPGVSVTIQEGDAPPVVTISPASSTMEEVGGSAAVTVTQNEISGFDTTVTFVYGGTAALGTDFTVSGNNYTPSTQSLVIPAGMLSGSITLTGLNKPTFGPDLVATAAIQSVSNGVVTGNPFSSITIKEGNPGPAVTLALTGSPIPEIGGLGTVTASLPAATTQPVVLHLSFSGTARLGINYNATGTYYDPTALTLTIPAGSTSSTLTLQAIDDGLYGPNLSIVVAVQSVGGGVYTGSPVFATITNQDPQPSVSLSSSVQTISDNGGQATVTATLSGAAGLPIVIPLTFGGTAVLGTNYTVSGSSYNPSVTSLSIPAGQTSASILITGIPAKEYGPNLSLSIAPASTGPPVTGPAVNLTIENSTAPPTLIVNNIALSQSSPSAVFNVLLSEPSSLPVTLLYNTVDVTAVASIDYQATSGTLTFTPGQTVQTITVPLINDHLYGPLSKTFDLNLEVTNGNAMPATVTATATIFLANPVPTMTIQGTSLAKPASGQEVASFTVTLSAASSLVTTVDFATSDITAKAGTDYVATQGLLTFAPGQTTATIPVTILGNSTPTGSLTFAVNLSNPVGAIISGSAQAVGVIQDINPTVGLAVTNTVLDVNGPNNAEAIFAVTLTPPMLSQIVTVQYSTADGTAVAGQDYLPAQGVLTFNPGQSTAMVSVTVFGVLAPEATKNFTLTLSNANPSGTPIAIAQATATIIYNVVVPAISINSVQVLRPASGTTPATFTVSLSAATQEVVMVNYATANGTAVAGTDYQAESGTLTFQPGQTTASVVVPVIGSILYDGNTVFYVNLSSPVAATLVPGQSQGTGTIVNQVSAPLLSISDPVVTKGVAGTSPATFTVTLSAASALVTTVNYASANGTAQAGIDYLAVSGTLAFPPGATSEQISVPVIGNYVLTPTVFFYVTLSTPVNANLGRRRRPG